MSFEWTMAWRFLREGRGQTIFILLGIATGIAVQIFIGTLIAGLQEDLLQATVGTSPHIVFKGESREGLDMPTGDPLAYQARNTGNFGGQTALIGNWSSLVDDLEGKDGITAVSPLAQGNAFAQKGSERRPVLIQGVDLNRANEIYRIEQRLVQGTYRLGAEDVLIGTALAQNYQLEVGDPLVIELPGGARQSLTISGIFDFGNQNINEVWLFLDLDRAMRLLGYSGRVLQIETQVEDVFQADILAQELSRAYAQLEVTNWKEDNADLLVALQSQSSSTYTIQVFVLLAVTLGIASVLAVSVVQKSKQIGILKAMGISGRSASRIFLLQGGLLGFAGSLVGVVLGYLLTQFFLWGTSLGTGEPIFPLVFKIRPTLVIVFIATLASIAASFFPARRSANLNPIDVIRG